MAKKPSAKQVREAVEKLDSEIREINREYFQALYQPRSRKWTHYLDGTEYSGKVVLALAEDSGGNIWVGGYGIGVYCIDKQTGRVQKKEKRNAHPEKGMATDYVYAIYAEGDYVWFGGLEGEFTRYDIRTDTYTSVSYTHLGDRARSGASCHRPRCIYLNRAPD